MKKFTLHLKKLVFFCVCLVFFICTGFDTAEESTALIQNILIKYYDSSLDGDALKRFEINITNTGFCRYRKTYSNGKVEFFAFNLTRFKNLDYYGTTTKGELYLRTKNDDVIVQTYNDKNGDIDSMGTYISIPLKEIDQDVLNNLAAQFKQLNTSLAKNK
jgi:hypothetical protein